MISDGSLFLKIRTPSGFRRNAEINRVVRLVLVSLLGIVITGCGPQSLSLATFINRSGEAVQKIQVLNCPLVGDDFRIYAGEERSFPFHECRDSADFLIKVEFGSGRKLTKRVGYWTGKPEYHVFEISDQDIKVTVSTFLDAFLEEKCRNALNAEFHLGHALSCSATINVVTEQ